MLLIVESQTSHSFHVFQSQRRQKHSYILEFLSDFIFSEYLAFDDFGPAGFCNIIDTMREDGVTIICPPIFSKKSYKTLQRV